MQRLVVTHFAINPQNGKGYPAVIEARENGLITGVFNASPYGNIYNVGQSQPFAFISKVKKDPVNSKYFLVEIGRFEN